MAITEVQSRETTRKRKNIRFNLWRPGPFVLLVPALASIAAVSVYPVLLGLWLSFRDTTLASPTDAFIGLGNYLQLFSDSQFWNAWTHTIQFTAASTLLETLFGLMIALVLSERYLGRGIVRAAMLVPWAIPTVVTSKMFGWLFDGQNGIVNYLLRSVGLIQHNVDWYGSPDFALATIVIADVWKTTPFMALLLLAGLQTIPDSLAEASDHRRSQRVATLLVRQTAVADSYSFDCIHVSGARRVPHFRSGLCLNGWRPRRLDRGPFDTYLQTTFFGPSVRLRIRSVDHHVHHGNSDRRGLRRVSLTQNAGGRPMSDIQDFQRKPLHRLQVSFMGSRTRLPLRFINRLLVGWAIPVADVYFDATR